MIENHIPHDPHPNGEEVRFKDLVRIMVNGDFERLGLPCPGEGSRVIEERFGGWHRWEHQVISMEEC